MGEPLLNMQNLCQAISVICDKNGFNLSKRRITVSTCGISEGIIEMADNLPGARLALSLVTADEKLRNQLIPVSRNQPLAKIKASLLYYQKKSSSRITLETVLLGNINTSKQDAVLLADFAQGLDVVVNLIPWNACETQSNFKPPLIVPANNEVGNFKKHLEALGLKVTCRLRKGKNIAGACGQLGQIIGRV